MLCPQEKTQLKNQMDIPERYALTEATYYILLALVSPRHGYGILQDVREWSKGRLIMRAGTLYGGLKQLAERQWIVAVKQERRFQKKEYVLTAAGREMLRGEMERLEELLKSGKKFLRRQMIKL
jgi:DNA-binding PadR family transcriptional regulator